MSDIVQLLAKLAVTHDRQTQQNEASNSALFLLWDLAIKERVTHVADSWRAAAPAKKDGGPSSAHPLGCSMRAVVHALLLDEARKLLQSLEKGLPSGSSSNSGNQYQASLAQFAEAVSSLAALPTKAVEEGLLRLKPLHRTYLDTADRPWLWTMHFGYQTKQDVLADAWITIARVLNSFRDLPSWQKPSLEVRIPKVQDGPIVKELVQICGLGAASSRDRKEDADDEAGTEPPAKFPKGKGKEKEKAKEKEKEKDKDKECPTWCECLPCTLHPGNVCSLSGSGMQFCGALASFDCPPVLAWSFLLAERFPTWYWKRVRLILQLEVAFMLALACSDCIGRHRTVLYALQCEFRGFSMILALHSSMGPRETAFFHVLFVLA